MADPQFRRLTPVVVVPAIEPVLEFWTRLGAKVGVSVPHGERLGFVCIQLGGAEVMYQSVESVQADMAAVDPKAYRPLPQQALLFVEVASLADIESRLAGCQIFLPRRETFYGSRETGYVDPAGNLVIFAEFPAPT
jgi:hypothetical protein